MKKSVVVFLVGMMCQVPGMAQEITIFPMMRSALSARSAGMGGSTVALTGDVNTVVLNPAVLTTVEDRSLSATFFKNVLDINSGALTFCDSMDLGSYGATINYVNYGSNKRVTKDGQVIGSFAASDLSIGFTFARQIDTLISWGVTPKVLYSSFDDMSSLAIALDAGILFRLPKQRTNIAMSILNLGTQVSTYDGVHDRLPLDVRIGVNHRLRGLPLMVHGSLNHLADEVPTFFARFRNFSLGGELYVGKYVQVRLGYDNGTRNLSGVNVSTQLTGVSAGVGLNLPSMDFDYALSTLGSAAILHRVSVSFII